MGLRRITFVLLAAIILIPACSRDGGNLAGTLPSSDALATEPAATPSPLPTATLPPTSTPKPTPIVPSIEVESQTITEDGRLVIDRVIIPDAGWLVVYQDDAGDVGDLLGYERLVPGENLAVTVIIEAREATPSLIAQLHDDTGESGVFEFPEPDSVLDDGSGIVAEIFTVDLQLPIPSIDIPDQAIGGEGLINVNSVFALEPGWLVVHNYENNEVGAVLGQVPVQAGHNNDFAFPIRWRIAATELLAVLYEDAEQPGGFDKEADLPVLDEGTAVVAEFSVSLPPDIFVIDQPLREGTITVDRVTSNGPGWIVAYYDDVGQLGLIIGSALVKDGVNELVELEVLETAASPRLYLVLHEDTGNLGEFDFPAADLAVVFEGKTIPPYYMHITPGNYLITKDQPLGEEKSIIVPFVVTDLDTWLVIYNLDDSGEVSEVLGQTWLPAGINRDIPVTIDPELAAESVVAMLHQDNAPFEEFDFPNGVDIPLLRNLLPIQSPFTLKAAQEEVRPLP